jgi:predicted amidophosphoribosyltransferase
VRLLESLVELAFPTRCAGCELPGSLLCDTCRANLPLVLAENACPRCGAPYGALVCTECWNREWAFEAALSLAELEEPLARAVVLHKDAAEQRLGALLGGLLAEQIAGAWPGWPDAVAFVPATRAAYRRRGFDHGRAIAREVARQLERPLLEALARGVALDQRTLGREQRARNVAGSFSAMGAVSGRVLLCDDVFTTGATLDAAAAVLAEAGAGAVRCATVARAW